MRGLGKSSALRIAAAFVLLMLRPSMIVLGMALLNDFSDAHAAIQYISEDLEAHQLHPSRDLWAQAAPARVQLTGVFIPSGTQRFSVPTGSAIISASFRTGILNGRSHRSASRSPPL